MNNVHRVRIANRLAQLFGRINRGRNDYGAFLIEGNELNKWLSNDRNLVTIPSASSATNPDRPRNSRQSLTSEPISKLLS